MVICEKHNFIFIRIPKNASTSLATFFIKNYCSKDDYYTSVGDSGIENNKIPQHVLNKHRKQYRFIHLTLNEIINEGIITQTDARNKRVIGVIRNPLERQLSLYFFLNRNKKSAATPAHFRSLMHRGYYESDGSNHILQTDYLKIGNENVGEFWNYDNLSDRVSEFKERYGKPSQDLQAFKSNFKPPNRDLINEYYDSATRKAVEEYFAKDFEIYEDR